MTGLINYNELWQILHQKKGREVDWDKRAPSFYRAVSGSEEAGKIIPSLNLLHSDTVLDMGAGTGRFAIPIASHVSHLTALEPSSGMVSFLEKGMKKAGLSNYTVIQKRWEDVEIGLDIPVHDVVFASNSLGFPDLAQGLKKLDMASRRSVHILWFAGRERHPMDPELQVRLGLDETLQFAPDYLFLANVLHDMGIYANVSVEEVRHNHTFENLDDAVLWWTERGNFEPHQVEIIRDYLKETLKPVGEGQLGMERIGKRARIWWEKENRAE